MKTILPVTGNNRNKKRRLASPLSASLAVAVEHSELNRLLLEWFRAYAFMLIHKNDANIQPNPSFVNKNSSFFDEIPPFGRNDATIMEWVTGQESDAAKPHLTPTFIIFYAAVIPNEA